MRPLGYFSFDQSRITTIEVEVTSTCDADECTSATDIDTLCTNLYANFASFTTSGSLQEEIHIRSGESVPQVAELFGVTVDATSLEMIGDCTNPLSDFEETVEIVLVTMTGSLSTTSMDTSSFDEDQLDEVKEFFADGITSSLGTALPPNSVVTITSIDNGVVSYEITMEVSEDTTDSAVDSIEASLSDPSSLQEITSSVVSHSSASSDSDIVNAMSGMNVTSNTMGTSTQSTHAKGTTSGQFTTNLSGLSSTDMDIATTYFKDAITAALEEDGTLPTGSIVEVSISNLGVVSFEIIMYLPSGDDNAPTVNTVTSRLADASTLDAISSKVVADTASSSSPISALLSLDITDFVEGETYGVSFKLFYPDWVNFDKCVNDGWQPPFMMRPENKDGYLFTTREKCCNEWFEQDPNCNESNTNVEKFYPIIGGENICSKKKITDFGDGEIFRYNSLEECCVKKFSHAKEECCESSGLGGCPLIGNIVWMPMWGSDVNKCEERSQEALAPHEIAHAKGSEADCCEAHYDWPGSECLE